MSAKNTIPFWKMHGLGNDFMLIDGSRLTLTPDNIPIPAWADRHTGVGFDQLLWLMPSKQADVLCRIFNPDGSEAEQCGNGMRCVAAFLYETGQIARRTMIIETVGGMVHAAILPNHTVQVTLGVPVLVPGRIEITIDSQDTPITVFALSLGNPHAIIEVDSLTNLPVATMAKAIAADPCFPQGVNVGFMHVMDRHHIQLRTVERGAGETLSCGSNACAAVVAGVMQGRLVSPVTVKRPLGILEVAWQGVGQVITLTGPAITAYQGTLSS